MNEDWEETLSRTFLSEFSLLSSRLSAYKTPRSGCCDCLHNNPESSFIKTHQQPDPQPPLLSGARVCARELRPGDAAEMSGGGGGWADGLLSYETLVHAVAGATGSVTAMTVFFPLDTAKIRLQVDEKRKSNSTPVILAEIAKEEGLQSLYRGWLPVISSLCCSNFVYFYTFNTLKKLADAGPGGSRHGKDLLMGVVSGVVNVLLTTPMWVVNTRLKLQGAKFRNEDLQQTHYRGIFDAFSQIIANEGVSTLWNGTLPSLILVLNPAVQFMFYEALKRRAGEGGKKISSAEIFLIGAVSKAVATTATYPLQTVQAILRFGQYKGGGRGGVIGGLSNIFSMLMDRIKRFGVLGLYKGLEAKLLQTVLTAALMFVVYEKITAATFKVMGLNKKLKQ